MNSRYKKVCHTISCTPILRNSKKINILSIDGGGIRAYLAVIFLYEMEIRYKKSISKMFDMVGGSGFGAMVAAALLTPSILDSKKPKYSTSDLLNLFNQ